MLYAGGSCYPINLHAANITAADLLWIMNRFNRRGPLILQGILGQVLN
jgi:hypothetical protein